MTASKAAIGPGHVLDDERLPHLLSKPIAKARAMRSTAPPAGCGRISFTGRDG